MTIQLVLINGQMREVALPDFTSVSEVERFQQFLAHFSVNGSMIDIQGRGIPFHSVVEAFIKKGDS
jgi:hypothetical protein